jgi:integrase
MGLTVKRVDKLLREGNAGRHSDHDSTDGVKGLYLCIKNQDNASWSLRYQLAYRAHWMGLGSARDISLAQAREKANAQRAKLTDKVDPLTTRRSEQAARALAAIKQISFSEAAKQYIEQHEKGWKNPRHREQWSQTLRQYALPKIGALPVNAVDTPSILRVLEPIWNEKTETASRLRGRIESILGWATVRGYRSGDNPARWKGHLSEALPKRSKVAPLEHYAAMPYADVPALVARLRESRTVSAQALLFLILTAARSNEAIGARWSEIDLKTKTWTVPAERMKGGKEHKVPLSDAALDLLRNLYREGDGDGFLFIGSQPGGPLSRKALTQLLLRMGVDVTVHGFRAGFSTWAAEQTNYPREVAEQSLAHVISNAVERSYKRTTLFDKRRQLMMAWAKFCMMPPVSKRERDNVVVPIGAR